MKTIGIIGGLGPMATVYYLELITRMTVADTDQEHPRIMIESIPDTPDRTAYILGKSSENPVPFLIKAGKELEKLGADFLAIPCVTAQFFYDEMQSAFNIPLLSLCANVADDIAAKGIKKVGILATSGTIESGVLEKHFKSRDIEVEIPDREKQDIVMEVIYEQVKKGRDVRWDMLHDVADSLMEKGAEKIILGCTELSLLKRDDSKCAFDTRFVDVLDVLAQKTVIASGAKLNEKYKDVIH